MTRTVQKIWFSSRPLVLWHFQSIWRTCLCERTWKHLPSAVPPRSTQSPRTGQKISQTLSPKVHASLYVFSYVLYIFFSSLSLLSFTPPLFSSPPQLASSPGVLSWGPAFPELCRRRITEKRGTSQECSREGLSRQSLCRPRTCQWPVRCAPCWAGLLHPAQRGQNSLNALSPMPWSAGCLGSPKATWGLAGRVLIIVQGTSAEICKIGADFLHTAWWCADYLNSYELAHSRSSPSAASQERTDIAPPILSCPEKASLTPLPPIPTINCATFACCHWRFLACSVPHAVAVALLWAPWQPRLRTLAQRVGSLRTKPLQEAESVRWPQCFQHTLIEEGVLLRCTALCSTTELP